MDSGCCETRVATPSVTAHKPATDNYRAGRLSLRNRPLVAVEVKAPSGGTDLGVRGTRRARGELVPDVHERLVHADDVVTHRAAWGLHEAPLSVRMSHPRWSVGHPFPPCIRCRPQPKCEELLSPRNCHFDDAVACGRLDLLGIDRTWKRAIERENGAQRRLRPSSDGVRTMIRIEHDAHVGESVREPDGRYRVPGITN